MEAPLDMDNHQDWGGQRFQNILDENSENRTERTFVAREHRVPRFRSSSQAGILASHSDDVFYPTVTHGPPQPFVLPDISTHQIPPHFQARAYNQQTNTFSNRPLPHPSSFSSYNNPGFAVPPPPPRDLPFYPPSTPHQSLPAYNFGPPGPPPLPRCTYMQSPQTYIYPQSSHLVHHSSESTCNHHCNFHSSSSYSSTTAKTLPSVSHISILTSKLDFSAWDDGVTALIHANGLTGHILDVSEPVDPFRPDRTPNPMPILPPLPLPRDLKDLNHWWSEDNIAQHILISRLGTIPRSLLPPSNTVTRTALSIYKVLCGFYGTSNHADCVELLNALHTSFCTTGRVPEYVSKWRAGISRLHSARFLFNIRTCISFFVRGLPLISAFTSLRASLPERLELIAADDMGAFIALSENVLHLDTIFRSASQVHGTRTHRPSTTTSAPSPPSSSFSTVPSTVVAIDSTSQGTSRSTLNCGNCKSRGLRSTGHTDGTCFQPLAGGGMEGRREEYLSNKGKIHAMLAECLDNASDFYSPSPPSSLPTTLDDDILLPPLANLCVSTFPANTDIDFDLYSSCAISSSTFPRLAFTTVDFTNSAFVSLVSLYNALLDSGCTHHIIRDRSLFSNYASSAISVGTANCGSLEALGTGDVKFRYPYGDRHVVFTLRGCLYAPTAPINLLSIGALVERGMSCLFSPGGITKVFFSADHLKLPGLEFVANVTNRLSLLKLDFICSSPVFQPTALPAHASPSDPLVSSPTVISAHSFPRLRLDSMLWHRRFGHIGMDATRAALTKGYVTGIQFDGPILRDHCIACIVGKSPQRSYSTNGNRATKVGELYIWISAGLTLFRGLVGNATSSISLTINPILVLLLVFV
jgi:hypothetical protein